MATVAGPARLGSRVVRLIMRLVMYLILSSLLAGCATSPAQPTVSSRKQVAISDPIDRLVTSLATSHGWRPWWAGLFARLDLSKDASPEQVVQEFCVAGSPRGPVGHYKVLEMRQVHITNGRGSGLYTAALLQIGSGSLIVLMQYSDGDWWTRSFDSYDF